MPPLSGTSAFSLSFFSFTAAKSLRSSPVSSRADRMFAGCLSPSECQICGLSVGLTTFRLVAPHILPLLAVFGAGGECSLSHATIRTLSPIVVPGNIYARNGCYALPRMRVQEMLEVIDRCIEGIPYVPLDDANAQARGLGNMVAFWERMRNICPKVSSYFGPFILFVSWELVFKIEGFRCGKLCIGVTGFQ